VWQPPTEEEVRQRLVALCEPLLEAEGLELVQLEYRRGRRGVVRLFIDRQWDETAGSASSSRGVTIEDCARVSRLLDPILDAEGLIDHAYTLEVSSPGVERPLTRPRDFRRFVGRLARIVVRHPEGHVEEIEGRLTAVPGPNVGVQTAGGRVQVPLDRIAHAHLVYEDSDADHGVSERRRTR